MKNQSLQLGFQIQNALGSDAVFSVMEGAVKASGGNIEAVMKGLGLLSGQNYYLPAEYAREFVYNKKLKYKVLSENDKKDDLYRKLRTNLGLGFKNDKVIAISSYDEEGKEVAANLAKSLA